MPGTPRFREYVRKTSDNHRIPQIETPDGQVIQDSIAIFDALESQFPEPPAYPPGIRQQIAARLFEFLIDATLGRSAWHYRWNYKDDNYDFVGREPVAHSLLMAPMKKSLISVRPLPRE